jgi:hypothetical protein
MGEWIDTDSLKAKQEFLSVTQAAELRGISRQSVLYAIKHNWKIRNNSLKIGKTWIIKREVVEAAWGVNCLGQSYLKR